MKKYYSVKEASRILSLSTNTIYKYVNEGKLSIRRIGKGRIKIAYQSILPFIQNPDDKEFSAADLSEERNILKQNISPAVLKIDSESKVKDSECAGRKNKLLNKQVYRDRRDWIFYNLFKSVFYLGLGFTYLLAQPFKEQLLEVGEYATLYLVLRSVVPSLPYIFIILGAISLGGLFKQKLFRKVSVLILFGEATALLFSSYLSFVAGNRIMIGFLVPMIIIISEEIVRRLQHPIKKTPTLRQLFERHLLIFVMSVAILTLFYGNIYKVSIPIMNIIPNIEIAIMILFLILIFILIYIQTPKGRRSLDGNYVYLLISLFLGVFAFLITKDGMWDVLLSLYTLIAFSIFHFLWGSIELKINPKKIYILVIAVLWVMSTVIFGIFSMKNYFEENVRQIISESNNNLSESLNDINKKLEEQKEVSFKYSTDSQLVSLISDEDSEEITEKAKLLYESLEYVSRVLVFNSDGIALGVYPRNTELEGGDFSSRDYFQLTKRTYKSYVSPTYINVDGTKRAVLTQPFFGFEDQFFGVIAIGIDLSVIYEDLSDQMGSDAKIAAIDSSGNYSLHWEENKLGKKAQQNLFVSDPESSDDYSLIEQKLRSIDWQVEVYVPAGIRAEQTTGVRKVVSLLIFINSSFSLIIALMIASGQGFRLRKKKDLHFSSEKKSVYRFTN